MAMTVTVRRPFRRVLRSTIEVTTRLLSSATSQALKLTPSKDEHLKKRRRPMDTSGNGVTIVRDSKSAEAALEVLYQNQSSYHACDTEVADIDIDKSPIGQGFVTCATIFCGPNVNFGNGNRLFIDNLDDAEGTLNIFTDYFEDRKIKKVWHNYSFDRHVLWNHGIDVQGFGGDTMHMARLWHSAIKEGYSLESLTKMLLTKEFHKTPMKELFSKPLILKNGLPSKIKKLPAIDELQRDEEFRETFIKYATHDAMTTWYLRESLEMYLRRFPWTVGENNAGCSMWDFYQRYWIDFGELLTDMERVGFRVKDEDFLPEIRQKAYDDIAQAEQHFKQWAESLLEEAKDMNIYSDPQKQQFFFGGHPNSQLEDTREFKYPNEDSIIMPGEAKPKKNLVMKLRGLGMEPIAFTTTGKPKVSADIMKKLAGNPNDPEPAYGTAYKFFGKGKKGKEACQAIDSLNRVNFLVKMLNSFIEPLIDMADHNHRVHCSLNLNTETGRLSSRRPNLQNQPALEKDVYKIRSAFTCNPGNILLVADYGQLELRVLAHMAKCKSMIEAFKSGGDFHSRTALGMYPHVQQAVDNGEVLLEWDYSKGEAPKPVLKDKFGAERRKAKTLNFSIAYGKTAYGLAKDWGVSKSEAQDTVNLWYRDRPEVKKWQDDQIETGIKHRYTRTLMGRYRPIKGIRSTDNRIAAHYARTAINTPIQGGAADIVMMAMLKIRGNNRLRQLGFKLILQIHDEIILEGPKEHQDEGLKLLKSCMETPFDFPMEVDLVVDASAAETWYEAK
uniref:DNA-directed DNA polymerase family A palm domain-containing protein n=1 Tax=Amorphochlora amoebiformis TaxID=1561963 RepID=A0A7S0H1P1_9EUKA